MHYHNRHRLPAEVEGELEATWWDNLDAMLARVDFITLNCPHTPETHHLIGAKQFALMQRHAYLINCARGEIVDEGSLAEALAAGKLAGAGLDVFENEPAIDSRLLDLPGVVLIPHMGSATFEGRQAMGEKVIANIRSGSMATARPIRCSRVGCRSDPSDDDAVVRQQFVGRQQLYAFGLGLCDQQPVERIAVKHRQIGQRKDMDRQNRQFFIAIVDKAGVKVAGRYVEIGLAELVFDGHFPDADDAENRFDIFGCDDATRCPADSRIVEPGPDQ